MSASELTNNVVAWWPLIAAIGCGVVVYAVYDVLTAMAARYRAEAQERDVNAEILNAQYEAMYGNREQKEAGK